MGNFTYSISKNVCTISSHIMKNELFHILTLCLHDADVKQGEFFFDTLHHYLQIKTEQSDMLCNVSRKHKG